MGESALCDFGWRVALENHEMAVRFVRGHKMRTLESLFDEVSSACQFPYYFGENWAAFKECLSDLSWLNCVNFLLIVTDADHVLVDGENEMPSLARALKSAIQEYNEQMALPSELKKVDGRHFQIMLNDGSSDNVRVTTLSDLIGLVKSDASP
jgi:hypothetical protein